MLSVGLIIFSLCWSNWPLVSEQGKGTVAQAVIFGLGSMFNHSRDPNIGWIRDLERFVVIYKALRDITAGEELCEFIVRLILH